MATVDRIRTAPASDYPMPDELRALAGDEDVLSRDHLVAVAAAAADVYDVDALSLHHHGFRYYARLWRDDRSEAWMICWMQDADTGYHDHDDSSGAVHVHRGQVMEENPLISADGRTSVRVTYGEGSTFSFDGAHIHRMCHTGEDVATTVHVYSPPLGRVGAYDISDAGLLRRRSVPGDVELRPGLGRG